MAPVSDVLYLLLPAVNHGEWAVVTRICLIWRECPFWGMFWRAPYPMMRRRSSMPMVTPPAMVRLACRLSAMWWMGLPGRCRRSDRA